MKKLRNTILIIWLLILTWGASKIFAYSLVNFEEYKKNLPTQYINHPKQIEQEFQKTKKIKCRYRIDEDDPDYYIIKPICLRKKQYPQLGFRETVDIIRPYIKGFSHEYNYKDSQFSFSGAEAQIDYSQISLGNQYHNTLQQKKLINYMHQHHINIKIHKKYFAKYSAKDFVFYPSLKETKHMGPCTKTNYQVSASALQWLYITPGEIFNLNKAISRLPGYCKWINGNKILPFYGGSCGTAGQFFRVSLLLPDFFVRKRYPHIRRRAQFYGKTIFGDDAAVLDDRKQLEIQNQWSFPIYFKMLNFDDYTYLVWISPVNPHKTVEITKTQTWPLQTLLIKKIIDNLHSHYISIQNFPSRYFQYFNGGV